MNTTLFWAGVTLLLPGLILTMLGLPDETSLSKIILDKFFNSLKGVKTTGRAAEQMELIKNNSLSAINILEIGSTILGASLVVISFFIRG